MVENEPIKGSALFAKQVVANSHEGQDFRSPFFIERNDY